MLKVRLATLKKGQCPISTAGSAVSTSDRGRANFRRRGRTPGPGSIRSYAKLVDVAAKAKASGDDETAVWRHEPVQDRRNLRGLVCRSESPALHAAMFVAVLCTHCRKP